MKKWLFNPFTYVAGGKALAIGGAIMAAAAVIISFNNGHFDGTLDVHFGAPTTLLQAFFETLISWVCLIVALYALGRIVSESSVRLIDIAGTTALARWPMLVTSFLGFVPQPKIGSGTSLNDLMKVALSPSVIIVALVTLPFIVWYIALLYNAFSVSANVKGGKAAAAFIGGLVIAEIISKVIILRIY